MEAEEERKRQSQRARFECDKAVLTANKKLAIAEPKLKAIELSRRKTRKPLWLLSQVWTTLSTHKR